MACRLLGLRRLVRRLTGPLVCFCHLHLGLPFVPSPPPHTARPGRAGEEGGLGEGEGGCPPRRRANSQPSRQPPPGQAPAASASNQVPVAVSRRCVQPRGRERHCDTASRRSDGDGAQSLDRRARSRIQSFSRVSVVFTDSWLMCKRV